MKIKETLEFMHEMRGKVYGIDIGRKNGNGWSVSKAKKAIKQMETGLAKV